MVKQNVLKVLLGIALVGVGLVPQLRAMNYITFSAERFCELMESLPKAEQPVLLERLKGDLSLVARLFGQQDEQAKIAFIRFCAELMHGASRERRTEVWGLLEVFSGNIRTLMREIREEHLPMILACLACVVYGNDPSVKEAVWTKILEPEQEVLAALLRKRDGETVARALYLIRQVIIGASEETRGKVKAVLEQLQPTLEDLLADNEVSVVRGALGCLFYVVGDSEVRAYHLWLSALSAQKCRFSWLLAQQFVVFGYNFLALLLRVAVFSRSVAVEVHNALGPVRVSARRVLQSDQQCQAILARIEELTTDKYEEFSEEAPDPLS